MILYIESGLFLKVGSWRINPITMISEHKEADLPENRLTLIQPLSHFQESVLWKFLSENLLYHSLQVY